MTMSANSKNIEPEKVMCEKLPMQEDGIVRLSTLVGDILTTIGNKVDEDYRMFNEIGYNTK